MNALDDPRQVWLYALYNSTGDVIYIGQSADPERRVAQHRATQPWRAEIADYRVLGQPTDRFTALIAEKRVIKSLQPVHNIYGSRRERARRPDVLYGRHAYAARLNAEHEVVGYMATTGRRRSA